MRAARKLSHKLSHKLSIAALGVVALAAVTGAAGCSDFHYYDINVSMAIGGTNGFSATGAEVTRIQVLVMTVGGADSGTIVMGPNANGLPLGNTGQLGIIEYSTFKDSGTLNFTVEAYDSATSLVANCKVGEGTTSMQASSMTTNSGMLVVNKTGDFTLCQ
ncbi:MAG TPA: hypothetical protein VIF57_27020 [Polyangia bacterium]|jgi:hypothetical protein